MIRLCCAVLSGVLLWACFPPLALGRWLVWLALAPLLSLLWSSALARPGQESRPLRVKAAFSWGWVTGYVFFLLNLKWLHTVTWPGMFILPAYLALYVALWAVITATVGRPQPEWRLTQWLQAMTLIAAAWTGLECLRSWLLSGFGWNGLSVAVHQLTWFAQWAEFLGGMGLSFFIVPVNALAVLWFFAWRRRQMGLAAGSDWVFPAKMSAVFVLAAAMLAGGGAWLQHRTEKTPTRTVELALVQPNIPQAVKSNPDEFYPIAKTLAILTLQALGTSPPPSLVVWPESALPATRSDEAVMRLLEEVQSVQGFTHVLGIDDLELDAFYNAVMLFRGHPAQAQVYHKRHLVPFGEYVPLQEWMEKLRWLVPELPQGSFNAGDSADPLPLPAPDELVQMIPLVCFEDTLGRVARKAVRAAPQIMINVTNDAWFLDSEAADQHLANAVFRCIELRRPLARSANTGVTAVVDTCGRITHALPRLEEGVLRASVPVPAAHPSGQGEPVVTFYARYGDVFSWGLLALTGGAIAWRGVRGRRFALSRE